MSKQKFNCLPGHSALLAKHLGKCIDKAVRTDQSSAFNGIPCILLHIPSDCPVTARSWAVHCGLYIIYTFQEQTSTMKCRDNLHFTKLNKNSLLDGWTADQLSPGASANGVKKVTLALCSPQTLLAAKHPDWTTFPTRHLMRKSPSNDLYVWHCSWSSWLLNFTKKSLSPRFTQEGEEK